MYRFVSAAFSLLWAFLLLGLHSQASASSMKLVSEAELVQRAQLIFVGQVERVEYRISDRRDENDLALPHTFVTYRIERSWKGRSLDGDHITLRFAGGPGEGERFVHLSGMPTFREGERDVLFVTGNGERACPLVGWSAGRYRVASEVVHTNDGRQLMADAVGRVRPGKLKPELWESHRSIGGRVRMVRRTGGQSAVLADAKRGEAPSPEGWRPLTIKGFARRIRSQLAKTKHAHDALPVASVDIREPFRVPMPRPALLRGARDHAQKGEGEK